MSHLSMLHSALQSIAVPPQISETARSAAGAHTGLLIRLGEWEQAHQVAQDLETPEASFWHGILHRQQGEWGNAGYWFRKVGRHAVYPALQEDAAAVLHLSQIPEWHLGAEWDALRFVEWCSEAAAGSHPRKTEAVLAIQVAEWQRLFDWCAGEADSI